MSPRITAGYSANRERGTMVQEPKKITLKMIAEKAGTSIGSVDRALMGRSGVHPATKERILQVAKDLGYKPNRLASALGRKRTIRIAMVYPRNPLGFYHEIDRGADCAAEELAQYGVVVEKLYHATPNAPDQVDVLKSIDPTQFDGIAVNSAGHLSSLEIDRLTRANLPVITFNTDAAESSRLFYIGNHSLQSGRMGAELLSRFLGGQGDVTVMGNFMKVNPFFERFGGFCDVIHTEYPSMRLFPCAMCNSDPHLAKKSLLDVLAQLPDLRGVFCTGYSSTEGAVEALRQLGRKDVVLIGFDIGGSLPAALEEGWCDALLFQDPFRQAYQAAHLLSRHILEGWLPPQPLLHIETSIVIKQNLSSYLETGSSFERYL